MQRDSQFPAEARAGVFDFFDEKSKKRGRMIPPTPCEQPGVTQHSRWLGSTERRCGSGKSGVDRCGQHRGDKVPKTEDSLRKPIMILCGKNPLVALRRQAGALAPHRR